MISFWVAPSLLQYGNQVITATSLSFRRGPARSNFPRILTSPVPQMRSNFEDSYSSSGFQNNQVQVCIIHKTWIIFGVCSVTRRFPRGANPEGKVFLPMTLAATRDQGLVDDLLCNPEQLRYTGWTEAEWRRHFETKGKLDRYWKSLQDFKNQCNITGTLAICAAWRFAVCTTSRNPTIARVPAGKYFALYMQWLGPIQLSWTNWILKNHFFATATLLFTTQHIIRLSHQNVCSGSKMLRTLKRTAS